MNILFFSVASLNIIFINVCSIRPRIAFPDMKGYLFPSAELMKASQSTVCYANIAFGHALMLSNLRILPAKTAFLIFWTSRDSAAQPQIRIPV